MAPVANWGVEQIPEQVRAVRVLLVRVTVHSLGPVAEGAQLSDNHWTIELLVSGGCVRLDMSLYAPNSATDFRGLLKVSSLPYQLSQNHVTYFDFEVIGEKTVGHSTDTLIENGRHRYHLHHLGFGCRHWM